MKYETTLFIPTHNRPVHLNRLLQFVENGANQIRIVIADSSEEKQHALNKRNIEANRLAANITLLPYGGRALVDKYLEGLSTVDTPTVCICGDDDLVFPEQILACSRFLDEHQDYSYARGRMVTFIDSASIALKGSVRIYPQREVLMEDPIDRIRYHLKYYKSNFYSVKRTRSIARNLQRALTLDIGQGLQERLVPILDLLDGKGALLNGLFMGRQIGQSMVDQEGRRTLPGKRLSGKDYAVDRTRNADIYIRFVENEVRARYSANEKGIDGLRRSLRKDLERYFLDKADPDRLSLEKLCSRLTSRIAQTWDLRPMGPVSGSIEAVLAHVRRHRVIS